MLSLFHLHRVFALLVLLVLATTLRAQTLAAAAPTPAGSVALLRPLGLAYDSQGDLFFAESGNHIVRRLDPAGNLTTVAGTGSQGFSGDTGPATMAQLDTPSAVALDTDGNLFIADTHNHRVRRVDAATHTIITIAGTGVSGFAGDGSLATAAELASPLTLVFGPTNLLYVADSRNHRVRSVNLQTGVITTVAGLGTQGFSGDGGAATSARLDTPSGLAFDSAGNLFIADTGNHRVRRIDAVSHTISTVAGASASSQLLRPVSLVVAASGLLVADAGSQQVLRLDIASGALTVFAGQGSQSFQGDGGPAAIALLDTPAALAVTPSGIVSIADAGNARIRQVGADGSISTVAGLGTLVSNSLTLSGATTQSYGATTLFAALSTGAASQGTVTLLDVTTGNTSLVAQATLAAGLARFSLSNLPAGVHLLAATFSGDRTHRAAQSQTVALTVAPIPITANLAGGSNSVFGQPLPSLAATLSGMLPADSARLAATVSVGASATSPPGTYPISIALSGPAAGNYTFTPPTAVFTITKAPVTTTLTQAGSSLTAHVVSSTTGNPTGSITLLTSAGTPFTSVLLNAAGTAEISSASLANGVYTFSAVYSGDADFFSAQSIPLNLTVGPPVTPADFSFTMAGNTTQTVTAGETAQFAINVKLSGTASLAGPITLSASALPPGFAANFDPPIIPPGGNVTGFTLSVATPRALASSQHLLTRSGFIAFASLVPFVTLVVSRRRKILLASFAALALCGCGARINSTAISGSTSKAYPITITGTTTNLDGSVLQHTATINLIVQ